jgi:quercetin dioxygenase-like cupin family protein
MTIAMISDAPQINAGDLTFRPLAVPSRGSQELAVWRAELLVGASSGAHSLNRGKILVVTEGRITLHTGGNSVTEGVRDALILLSTPRSSRGTRAMHSGQQR